MKNLQSPDPAAGGAAEKPAETIARLTAELAVANKTIETLKSQAAQASADEIVIREKMAFGLTREQAISVIKHQRAHDEHEAKGKAAKKETK